MRLQYSRIQIKLICPGCGEENAVNYPVRQVHCVKCDKEIPIDEKTWEAVLADIKKLLSKAEQGWGYKSEFTDMRGINYEWTSGRMNPYCTRCKADLKDVTKFEGVQSRFTVSNEFSMICENCGAGITVMHPEPWMSNVFPALRLIVNPACNDACEEKPVEPSDPVYYQCFKWKQGIEVSAKSRMVECGNCGARIYLPDELWNELNPSVETHKWFLGFS